MNSGLVANADKRRVLWALQLNNVLYEFAVIRQNSQFGYWIYATPHLRNLFECTQETRAFSYLLLLWYT